MTAGEPARRPRLGDVAAAAGVSPATVSLVLRGVAGPSAATRERVLEAAAQLGYRPDRAASLLASRRSRLVGVVMDIANPFHAQLVEDVQEAADRRGYDLVLSAVTRGRDERRAVETLLDSRCEALILIGPQAPAEHLAELDRQLPVVAVGRPVPSAAVDVVRAADDEGVAQAVDLSRGPGPPAHHLRRRRARHHRRRCAAAATSRPCAPTAWPTGSRSSGAATPRTPALRRPAPSSVPARPRPRCSPSTTGRRWGSSTRSSGPASTSPAPCPWSATTTARSPGSPTSTSRPSARTPRSSPSTPWPPSSSGSTGAAPVTARSSCVRS